MIIVLISLFCLSRGLMLADRMCDPAFVRVAEHPALTNEPRTVPHYALVTQEQRFGFAPATCERKRMGERPARTFQARVR